MSFDQVTIGVLDSSLVSPWPEFPLFAGTVAPRLSRAMGSPCFVPHLGCCRVDDRCTLCGRCSVGGLPASRCPAC